LGLKRHEKEVILACLRRLDIAATLSELPDDCVRIRWPGHEDAKVMREHLLKVCREEVADQDEFWNRIEKGRF
jgi:hypothetical protein